MDLFDHAGYGLDSMNSDDEEEISRPSAAGAFLAARPGATATRSASTILDGRQADLRAAGDQANRLAAGLKDFGPAAGAHVLSDNRPEQIVLYFALAKLGGVCVPINTAARGRS